MNNDYGIYLHYPFCMKKCQYCDFLSFPQKKDIRLAYEQALLEEIEDRKEELENLSARGKGLSLYIGGGTPSMMSKEGLESLLDKLRPYLTDSSEITLEVNPGTSNLKKLEEWKKLGINRLSFGLQSIHPQELEVLGRIHTYEIFEENYYYARKCGFDNINIDIMMALPGQSIESFESSLNKVIQLVPEHISVYSLIIEEGTPFYEYYAEADRLRREGKSQNLLPSEKEEREMYDLCGKVLGGAGYSRYEISNYSRKGRESIHNQGYWQLRPYIGFGLGASGYDKEGHRRSRQERELSAYLQKEGQLSWEKLSLVEEKEENIFLPLRTREGISILEYERRFGENFHQRYGDKLLEFAREGYLVYEYPRACYLLPKGLDVADYIQLELIRCIS